MTNDIPTVELFAGVGGLRKGLEESSSRYKVVWANDWIHGSQKWDEQTKHWKGSKNRSGEIYLNHWNDGTYHDQDIRTIKASDIPDCRLIVGGFPCQPFSMAGFREGFADFRGTLFFEIARIIEDKRPEVFLLENVKGLLSAQDGFCFLTILNRLDELGYNVEWKVLNTKHWLPQTRERVFIIGHLRERCRSQVFRFGETENPIAQKDKGELSRAKYFGTLTASDAKQHGDGNYILQEHSHSGPDGKGRGIRMFDNICSTLCSQMGTGGNNIPMVAPCLTPGRLEKRQNGRRFKEPGEEMFTLTAQDIHGVSIDDEIRMLTEIECERLQGFPDGWTKGVSRQQRYHALGNAVSVPVITYLAQLLLEALD